MRPPRFVADRITDLVTADTRALFLSTDVRVDTLVITRLPTGAGEPYRVETMRFQDVRDGERLPIGKGLVYCGPTRDFLDIRVWVSRDRKDAKTLSELFAERLNSAELRTAAGALLAITAVVPQAAAIVAATGAAATPGKITWELLLQVLPKSIGLFQQSLLASEQFGVGRNPPKGAYRAQRCSFAFEVTEVEPGKGLSATRGPLERTLNGPGSPSMMNAPQDSARILRRVIVSWASRNACALVLPWHNPS